MKTVKLSLSLPAVALVCALAGWPGAGSSAQTRSGKVSPQKIEKGKEVYAANCARCHGADGLGKTRMGELVTPPDLTDAAWQRQRSNARMIASVTRGRGQMPAFRETLSRAEIAAAVAYVRTLRK